MSKNIDKLKDHLDSVATNSETQTAADEGKYPRQTPLK